VHATTRGLVRGLIQSRSCTAREWQRPTAALLVWQVGSFSYSGRTNNRSFFSGCLASVYVRSWPGVIVPKATRNYKGFVSQNGSLEKFQQMKIGVPIKGSTFFLFGAMAPDSFIERTGRANFLAPTGIVCRARKLQPVKIPIGGSRLPNTNPRIRTKRQASSQPKSSRTSNLGRVIDNGHVLYHALPTHYFFHKRIGVDSSATPGGHETTASRKNQKARLGVAV